MTTRRHILLLLLAAMLPAFACATPAAAQDEGERLRAVKAAFIFNLLKFTTWPEGTFTSAEAPIRVAIIGDGDLARIMAALVRSQTVNGRPLIVERLASPPHNGNGIEPMRRALSGFHAVFIDDGQREGIATILRAIDDRPILAFSDAEHFAVNGGMIEIAWSGGRIVFEANLRSIQQSGLTVSSKALKLARKVHGQEGSP